MYVYIYIHYLPNKTILRYPVLARNHVACGATKLTAMWNLAYRRQVGQRIGDFLGSYPLVN